jgi:hypothetical protein
MSYDSIKAPNKEKCVSGGILIPQETLHSGTLATHQPLE